MLPPAPHDSTDSTKLVRSRFANVIAGPLPNHRCLALITGVLGSVLVAVGQDVKPTPTPRTADEPIATTFEVIVTGSNIPTAEEVGPQPVDIYRKIDIERLGAQSPTDFV